MVKMGSRTADVKKALARADLEDRAADLRSPRCKSLRNCSGFMFLTSSFQPLRLQVKYASNLKSLTNPADKKPVLCNYCYSIYQLNRPVKGRDGGEIILYKS